MNTMKFIRIKDVEEKTGLSRSTIYKRIAEKTFPRQISIGARAVAWNSLEVADWAAEQISRSRTESNYKVVPGEIFRKLENSLGRHRGNDIDEVNLAGIPTERQGQEGVL